MTLTAREKLDAAYAQGKVLCVGLDPTREMLRPYYDIGHKQNGAVRAFSCDIIDAVADVAAAIKLNFGFYLQVSENVSAILRFLRVYMSGKYPDLLLILDGKFGDVGNSSSAYASFAYDWMEADGVTLNGYLGKEGLQPYLDRADKLNFILCRTSNQGSDQVQLLTTSSGQPVYQQMAGWVLNDWDEHRNCGLVVGATQPSELAWVSQEIGELPLLIPGYGAQGGSLQEIMPILAGRQGPYYLSSSRKIITATDPAQAAREAQAEINSYL